MPAAGAGRRLGGVEAKALVPVAGRPLLAHALAAMESNRSVAAIVVVAPPDAVEACGRVIAEHGCERVHAVVPGGPNRGASVAAGLAALPAGPQYVAVHDAARPAPARGAVDLLLDLLRRDPSGAAGIVPGAPVVDTIRRLASGPGQPRSGGVVDRDELRAVQTPQLFDRAVLEDAYRRAGREGVEASDDAALVERAGHEVLVAPGWPENLKVTTPHDVAVAELLLAGGPSRPPPPRVGQGVDVHPFAPDRPLVLGGVRVPFDQGLAGHSDADVVAHAACEALLGAAGQGDLGRHFPPGEPEWAGVSSMVLCREVARLVTAAGFEVANLGVTVLCDRPRLASHLPGMTATLAEALGIEPARLSLSAKSSEGLGFAGRGEGILALSTCLLVARG